MPNVAELDAYWTVEELSTRCKASVDTVKKWLTRGHVKGGVLQKTKIGSRTLITETALQDFIRRCNV